MGLVDSAYYARGQSRGKGQKVGVNSGRFVSVEC